MVNRWKMLVGLVTLTLLVAGAYFVSDVYAKHCDKDGGGGCKDGGKCKDGGGGCDKDKAGGCDKHKEGGHDEQSSDKVKEDPNTPAALLKTAAKLLNDVDKTKDVASLMKHCNQMLNKAGEIMTACTQVTEGPGWFDSQSVETAAKLMKKCVEMTNKSQSLIPKDQKKTVEEKAVYKCPMGCETSDKPGKCSKCGMNLEKK